MIEKEETNVGAHAILVTPKGKIILQKRTDAPSIVNPGLISMFGGTLKANETEFEGLRRELLEELEIDVNNYIVSKLGSYNKTKKVDGISWKVNVFIVKNIDTVQLILHEGESIYVEFPEKAIENEKLTRITRVALKDFILKQYHY